MAGPIRPRRFEHAGEMVGIENVQTPPAKAGACPRGGEPSHRSRCENRQHVHLVGGVVQQGTTAVAVTPLQTDFQSATS